jgi:metal-dependent amidase/aminoacylase/carboxypeptidase family protein
VLAALGPEAVTTTEQSLGGEDFAWYLRHVPGALARLGVRRPGDPGPFLDLHRPTFDVDEAAIAAGVKVLVHTVLATLG